MLGVRRLSGLPEFRMAGLQAGRDHRAALQHAIEQAPPSPIFGCG